MNSPLNPTGCQIDQYIPDRCRVDTSLPAHSRPGTCATYSAQIAYRENLSGRDKKKMNRVPVIVWNPAYLEELEPVDPATFLSGDSQIVTAPASDDGDVVEEIVEEPEDGDMHSAMNDMYDFLGRLSERIQSFKDKHANPGQPPVVPDEVPAAVDEDVVGDIPEEAEEDPKQVLQDAVQSLSRLNDGLRSVLSLSRDTSSSQHTDVPNVDVWDTGKAIEQEFELFPNPTRKGLKDRLDNQVWDLLRLMQERVDQGTYNDTDIRLVEGLHVISVLHARLCVLTEIGLKHRAKRP